ncbi:hypothetical protein TNCT_289971 [Trichonephila clavata]|uniref:Uncharacterized protein n=1 Tax=Trichonephila clavata TaxID=2740835 RepID=A0A8X6HMA4_TRICU|nr:hypothetical protein TNCT_289971 [Trichonephila clavata]
MDESKHETENPEQANEPKWAIQFVNGNPKGREISCMYFCPVNTSHITVQQDGYLRSPLTFHILRHGDNTAETIMFPTLNIAQELEIAH